MYLCGAFTRNKHRWEKMCLFDHVLPAISGDSWSHCQTKAQSLNEWKSWHRAERILKLFSRFSASARSHLLKYFLQFPLTDKLFVLVCRKYLTNQKVWFFYLALAIIHAFLVPSRNKTHFSSALREFVQHKFSFGPYFRQIHSKYSPTTVQYKVLYKQLAPFVLLCSDRGGSSDWANHDILLASAAIVELGFQRHRS